MSVIYDKSNNSDCYLYSKGFDSPSMPSSSNNGIYAYQRKSKCLTIILQFDYIKYIKIILKLELCVTSCTSPFVCIEGICSCPPGCKF